MYIACFYCKYISFTLINIFKNQHLFNNFVLIPAVRRKSSQKVGSTQLTLKALFKTGLGEIKFVI